MDFCTQRPLWRYRTAQAPDGRPGRLGRQKTLPKYRSAIVGPMRAAPGEDIKRSSPGNVTCPEPSPGAYSAFGTCLSKSW